MTVDEKTSSAASLVSMLESLDPDQRCGDGVDVFWAALVLYYGPWAAIRMAQLSVSSKESAE